MLVSCCSCCTYLDTVQEWWVGEFEEVIVGGSEFVIRFRLGDVLDESLEVSRITLNLESVEVKNVGGNVVEESRVVYPRRGKRRNKRER